MTSPSQASLALRNRISSDAHDVHAVDTVDDLGERLGGTLETRCRHELGGVHRDVMARLVDDVERGRHRPERTKFPTGILLGRRVAHR